MRHLILVIIINFNFLFAQNKIEFRYDAAGNQIKKRNLCWL
jgi:hypothetical protein